MATEHDRGATSRQGHSAQSGAVKRVAILGPSGRSLVRMRGALIRGLVAGRHRVLCLTPDLVAADRAALEAMGAELQPWAFKRSMLRMLAERNEVGAVRDVLQAFEPHAVLAYGTHTLETGVMSAKAAGVPRIVPMFNGLLGDTTALEGRAGKRLRQVLSCAHAAVFQNRDNQRTCEELRLLPRGLAVAQVAGAGVDLAAFPMMPLPPLAQGLVFLMLATLDKERGVSDYCAAAREIKARAPNAQFLLAGPIVPGTGAAQDIEGAAGVVEYLGEVDNVAETISRAHVFVYPSHGEGLPRSVLEALAVGRPVITTNAPGCRDTVDAGVNGSLVAPGSVEELAAAMGAYLKRPDLIPAAARASRAKAERRFDEREATRAMMSVLLG